MTRFFLDVYTAHQWINDLIAKGSPRNSPLSELTEEYGYAADDYLDVAEALLSIGQQNGAVLRSGATTEIHLVPGRRNRDTQYQMLVRLHFAENTRELVLTGPIRPVEQLFDPSLAGSEAAIHVLTAMVHESNALLTDFEDYSAEQQ